MSKKQREKVEEEVSFHQQQSRVSHLPFLRDSPQKKTPSSNDVTYRVRAVNKSYNNLLFQYVDDRFVGTEARFTGNFKKLFFGLSR
jgi:hypothetical protein